MTRRCSVLKYTTFVIPCMLIAIVLLSACGSQGDEYRYKAVAQMKASEQTLAFTPPVITKDEEVTSYAEEPPAPPASLADIPKKIIKEGTIRYSVRDYKRTHKELTAMIARFGGDIISEQESRSETTWEAQLEIRVPSAKFDSCLNTLAGADETLLEKSITSKDVTEDYVDVSARMKARKEVEQRYLDILKQAKNVEDVLKVEAQLKTIREEVEAAQGHLQYIDHNVSMSAIHLSFFQTFSNTTPQGPGFFSSILFSIKDGWNHVLGAVISFIGLWPLWVGVAATIIIIRRYRRRRRLKALA